MAELRSMVPLLRAAEQKSLENPDESASVGAFNVNFYAQAEGILEGLRRADAPGIIQASRGANKFQEGPDKVRDMVLLAMTNMGMVKHPISLHLDHGTVETAIDCVRGGFSSVMIDTSVLPYDENIAIVREVAEIAHKKGLSVEGEYGGLGGIEEDVEQDAVYSNPLLVPQFFAESNADALAVTYGTSHGPNKFGPDVDIEAVLKLSVVTQSYQALVAYGMNEDRFLVGHGSSTVPKDLVDEINASGGSLKEAKGVPLDKIKEGRKAGIRKFNIDTDLRLGITATARKYFIDHPGAEDSCEPLGQIKKVFDGTIAAKDKNGNAVPPGELTDPRSYLDPVNRDILRQEYKSQSWDKQGAWEELMLQIKDRIAAHVEMLVTDVFKSAGLASSVK